ncbi:hypothetical protein PR202_gb28879 [Eleusine coracana subsp. coracana]|uniref:NHL repeat-containing protein n=1 Tax=Eleusine coracana subsp. coracana TaxID=191504 RepID=A0AAV5FYF9_ELECO|nr:hypothetical protein PR202_gb28879 [Eleusine coracana subsp. coracana]
MAQASAWALLRRLRRHRDPAAALLRRRLLSSVSESSSPGSLPGTNHLGVHGGSRGLSAWVGSHPRPRHPRRQHVAATATRAAHQAASSSESPVAAASTEAGTVASHSEAVPLIKSAFGKLEGSKDPVLFSKSHEEPEVMIKAIEELTGLKEEPSENVLSRVSWQKEESFKEPCVGSFRNLLLYHPACLSVDEDGDRIFISDSNHHRIVISNSDGMVMDSIGSLPGFEDGEFESAKFLRPAASFYHTSEDCLYIVDSENHAIRKADLERRIVETVYPVFNKSSGILSWIIDKLGLKKEVAPNIQDFDADLVALPWHLLQISEDNLLVADRRFEVPWILKISTGEKLDIGRGRAEVMESYEQIVNERCTLLKDVHTSWSSSAKEHSDSLEKIPNEELVSSVSRFQNNTVFCDKDGQRVLKHNLGTKNTSTIQFSN